jgi:hypothetical protein
MSACFKVFFTSPDDLKSVCDALADEMGAGEFVKTPDSLEHFPLFEAKHADGVLSLKRIENRGERGVYRLSLGDIESDADNQSAAIIDKLYGAGFESVMDQAQFDAQFMSTAKFTAG